MEFTHPNLSPVPQNSLESPGDGHPVTGMPDAGLYLHIPFCGRKCGYCDFYSVTTLESRDEFVNGLLAEINLISPNFQQLKFDTIFMGGGTPSLLSSLQLARIWDVLHKSFSISDKGEFTIEANPGTLDPAKVRNIREIGFNRLSMGAQSFNPEDLKFLERIHTVKDIYDNFEAARKAGFSNINLDLITAFPGLTLKNFNHTLQETVSLNPEHISCYTLIFEPGTSFFRRMKKNELKPMDSEQEAEFYRMSMDYLDQKGYPAYEISNFSRENRYQCQHNLKYWDHQPYLGLGPSAHSFVSPKRWWNQKSLTAYLKKVSAELAPVDREEILNANTLEFEYIFLHLRLRNGINLPDFQKRFNNNFQQKYNEAIQKLTDNEMIVQGGQQIKLSTKGWLLADEISTYF
jgi:oxygen-independent coproporphyrinogen-3 oxidase